MPWVAFWVSIVIESVCSSDSVLLASTIALKLVPHTNVGGSLACLYLLYSYWA